MITSSLISENIWSDVPEDNKEAFLYLALEARRRLLELLHGDDEIRAPYSAFDWQRQYVWELTSIADTLGIGGLPAAENAQQSGATLGDFDAKLARIITAIRVQLRDTLRSESVQLSYSTKDDIRSQLEELRAKVNASNLSDRMKSALHNKIDAVEAELENKRTGLRPIWILAGALAAAVSPTTSTLADLPGAIKTVQKMVEVVHREKAEEEEGHRLKTEPPRLTHDPIRKLEDKSVANAKSEEQN